MSVDGLKKIAVDAFALSVRRPQLWVNFVALVDELKATHLTCELWIDGSFLTQKIEPDDVDFVVDVPVYLTETPTAPQRALLSKLGNLGFCKDQKLHTFIMFTAPLIHKLHAASVGLHEQWRRDFGFSYVKKVPKGIAVIKVQP